MNIFHLLGDEFLDGCLTLKGLNVTTSYASLKKTRKNMKMFAMRKQFDGSFENTLKGDFHWLKQVKPMFSFLSEQEGDLFL